MTARAHQSKNAPNRGPVTDLDDDTRLLDDVDLDLEVFDGTARLESKFVPITLLTFSRC